MTNDEIKIMLQDFGIGDDIAEEFIRVYNERIEVNTQNKKDVSQNALLFEIQRAIDRETDWRTRAALAARLISMKIDE